MTQLRSFAASFRLPNFCHPFILAAGRPLSLNPSRFRSAFPKTMVKRERQLFLKTASDHKTEIHSVPAHRRKDCDTSSNFIYN